MEHLPSSRQELIHNAVLFLNDSKVQSSSLTSRIEFLQSKGLTEPEIEIALQQARSTSTSPNAGFDSAGAGAGGAGPSRPPPPAPQGGYYPGGNGGSGGYTRYAPAPPEVPRRDWRDLFIMAVVSGGVVYGLSVLARKYLLPHLQPPASTAFQSTSSDLSEQYDEASRLLASLQDRTDTLVSTVEEEHERVAAAVEEVEEAVKVVKDGEERWREEMRDIRAEVESVRELVPRLIEKHAQSQTAALAELQSELRSLKTLLVSRQGLSGTSNTDAHSISGGAGTNGSGVLGSSSPTQTQLAANALLAPKGRGIPAWQMPTISAGSVGSVGSVGSSRPASRAGAEEAGGENGHAANGAGNGTDEQQTEER